jgi:hypothetical protein
MSTQEPSRPARIAAAARLTLGKLTRLVFLVLTLPLVRLPGEPSGYTCLPGQPHWVSLCHPLAPVRTHPTWVIQSTYPWAGNDAAQTETPRNEGRPPDEFESRTRSRSNAFTNSTRQQEAPLCARESSRPGTAKTERAVQQPMHALVRPCTTCIQLDSCIRDPEATQGHIGAPEAQHNALWHGRGAHEPHPWHAVHPSATQAAPRFSSRLRVAVVAANKTTTTSLVSQQLEGRHMKELSAAPVISDVGVICVGAFSCGHMQWAGKQQPVAQSSPLPQTEPATCQRPATCSARTSPRAASTAASPPQAQGHHLVVRLSA